MTKPRLQLIDAHTHLEMLEANTADVIAAAQVAGVSHMITIGCHPNDFDKVCTLARDHYPVVAATLGVHPHEAKFYTDDVESQIRSQSSQPYIIGIGEIGLDYYYNHSDPATQRQVFHRQMALAMELGLPVEIHSRDAEDDTAAELVQWKGKVKGLLHCFSGTQKLADKALEMGFYISLSGVVTFKNAETLRDVVKTLPLDRILVETDAPFLSPVPVRGKKNQPAYVVHTAQKVAEIKGISVEELQKTVEINIRTLFPKWKI